MLRILMNNHRINMNFLFLNLEEENEIIFKKKQTNFIKIKLIK